MSGNGLHGRARDTLGLSRYILDNLAEVEQEFFDQLVRQVERRSSIALSAAQRDLVTRRLGATGVDLATGGVENTVLQVVTETTREGGWAPFLDAFVLARPVGSEPLTFERRRRALQALDRLPLAPAPGLDPTIAAVLADLSAGVGTDPVQLVAPNGQLTPWDFSVDLFDDARQQIKLADNIRAAGALMWCYDIGERLGVYRLTDALVYRWWIGLVDFADTELTAQLYRYYKLRDERPTEEERFLLYRRVLNVGAATVGERVVINEEFPQLWRTLMEEVALFIDRSQSSFREDQIDRQGIEQAIQELQYNLTERMAGMALTQVTEMYNQLRQTERDSGVLGGLDLLGHPEVIGQLSSGRRRDEWSVIERLAKEEFGTAPNVSALRNSAVDGARVVQFVAEFEPGRSDEAGFVEFVRSARRWILAQKVAGQGLLGTGETPDAADDGYGGMDDEYAEFVEEADDAVVGADEAWVE